MGETIFSNNSRANFNTLASDSCNRIGVRYFDDLVRHVTETAVEAAKLGQDTEDLEQELKKIIDINNDVKVLKTVSRDLTQAEEELTDAPEKFAQMYELQSRNYANQSEFDRFGESKDFGNFKQLVWEIEHPDNDMPPKRKWFKDSGENEDDIEVVSSKTSYTCPLSLELLSDPHTSSLCHHSFSYKAITSYLHNNPKLQLQCPVAGCVQEINLGVMSRDTNLARRVERYKLKHASNNNDEDDEYETV